MSSLDSAIRILQCFSAHRPQLGVSEVARRLEMPKSTVSRLMKGMERSGFLEQDEASRCYRPGLFAFRLGNLYRAHLSTLDLVDDAVSELVEEFGLTGYTGVLNGTDVVILRVRQGWYPVRFVLEPGYRVPAWVTAIGKALLARASEDEVRRMHPEVLHYPTTDVTRTIDDLLRELDEVRVRRWADAAETTFVGFGAVGVAVGKPEESQPVAFCLSYPTNAVKDDQRDEMVGRLLELGERIGRRCGDSFWSDGRPAKRAAKFGGNGMSQWARQHGRTSHDDTST